MTNQMPSPIGPISEQAAAALRDDLTSTPTRVDLVSHLDDPFDRDAQLAWFLLNEASFGGWHGVSDDAEWNPRVVELRQRLETWFSDLVSREFDDVDDPVAVVESLLTADGPSISSYLAECGTEEQLTESLLLRFPYQAKEADPHTFAIPRLEGAVKRALVEIQAGEYGVGYPQSHAELYLGALRGLGVDPSASSILDRLPGVAFATNNLVSMAGLSRARRGVAIGQLALFEMDSVSPNGNMVCACDRLGLDAATRRFFDVHVMADTEHEAIAAEAFLVDYPREDPTQLSNILFGIKAQGVIDRALAHLAVSAWSRRESALVSARADSSDGRADHSSNVSAATLATAAAV